MAQNKEQKSKIAKEKEDRDAFKIRTPFDKKVGELATPEEALPATTKEKENGQQTKNNGGDSSIPGPAITNVNVGTGGNPGTIEPTNVGASIEGKTDGKQGEAEPIKGKTPKA